MFWADTCTTATAADPVGAAVPLGAGDPLGAADGVGATDAGADGATDALATTDGTGVGEGAGAYVQPGVDEAQAATARTVKPAASRRVDRMSGWDLEVGAGDRISVFFGIYRV